jgi:hypothetical protein
MDYIHRLGGKATLSFSVHLAPDQFQFDYTQKNLSEKEHSDTFQNSNLFPENQQQMQHS